MVALHQMDTRVYLGVTEARDVGVLVRAGCRAELAPPAGAAERREPRAGRGRIEAAATALEVQICATGADETAAAGMLPPHRGRQGKSA